MIKCALLESLIPYHPSFQLNIYIYIYIAGVYSSQPLLGREI
ncbi:hypothetical protein OENI_20054 [Oenococcus oeni]|nr:hypothetical protein OENI_20054 [Oenococcus oeni]SYW14574.1 hypothetical protein OENI_560002 [Oenococcus oeni]